MELRQVSSTVAARTFGSEMRCTWIGWAAQRLVTFANDRFQVSGGWTDWVRDEDVVIVGGGIGGLGLALALGRAGHRVTIFDRDDLSVADGVDAAFALPRRGAPQTLHTHGFLARLAVVLRERFPDVHADLLSAGVNELGFANRLGEPQPGDEDLVVLLARRSTVEWALRRAVAQEESVTCRPGTAVSALVGGPAKGAAPAIVSGVELAGGETISAGTVVLAGGRRQDVPRLLAPLGVEVPELTHDTGIVYLTRWYQHHPDPAVQGEERVAGDLGFIKYLVVPGDNGTLSATIAINADDADARRVLLDPDAFDRAVRQLPGPDGIFAREVGEPLGPVHPMGGLVNRIRRFVDSAGDPLVQGVHAIGDAHTCTNPFYGRGCSLAMVQATQLADAFAAHPDDPAERSRMYEKASVELVEPWYHVSVETDRAARARATQATPEPDAFGAAIHAVLSGSVDDPVVGRGVVRMMNLLSTPEEVFADPDFLSRISVLMTDPDVIEAGKLVGPSRDELLGTVAA